MVNSLDFRERSAAFGISSVKINQTLLLCPKSIKARFKLIFTAYPRASICTAMANFRFLSNTETTTVMRSLIFNHLKWKYVLY